MEDRKVFVGGGMNLDDAPENLAQNEYFEAYNIKLDGVSDNESGDVTNVESTTLISYSLPSGINKTIGSQKFESINSIIDFTYNSNGYHRINEYNYNTGIRTKLFENKTDSGGVDILPLDPKIYVKDIKLIQDTYLFFLPSNRVPSIINLQRLREGGYGTLTLADFTLIKKQPVKFIKPIYGDNAGASSNLLANKSFVFREQFIYLDNEPSSWSAISDRVFPSGQQSNQTDVTKDNLLILSVDIGTNRVKEIRIATLINDSTVWSEIKNVKRSYVLTLPASIDIPNNVLEAYNPTTNEYTFIFTNNGSYQPVDVLDTDVDQYAVPLKSEAAEIANGNVLLLANNTEGYNLITPSVSIIPSYLGSGLKVVNTNPDYIKSISYKAVAARNAGRALLRINYKGITRTGDKLIVSQRQDDTGEITTFEYIVPIAYNGNTQGALNDFASLNMTLGFNVYSDGSGGWYLDFVSRTACLPLNATEVIADTTSGNFNSFQSIKLNSSYQLAIQYRDAFQRALPLVTDNSMKVNTLHFGATQGNVPVLNWTINHAVPPNAVDYQWCITKNLTHLSWLYINGKLVNDLGSWDAAGNTPALDASTGVLASYYTVSKSGTRDIGSGSVDYAVGDIVIFNGTTYDRIPYASIQNNGDVLNFNNTNILTIYVGSLNRFNKKNSSSVLNYGFSSGDRATIHYYKDTEITYLSNPAIDVEVLGYDPTLNILRIRKPANLSATTITGKEVMVEVYTPKKQTAISDNVFFEVSPIYTITNGVHDTLTGQITKADCFIKTRDYTKATDIAVVDTYVVEDPNFSDFNISNYYPYGRPHIFNSLAKQVVKKADIRFSDESNVSNNLNLLNKFYDTSVETYDVTKGGFKILQQRGNQLIGIQEFEHVYIPINQSIIEDQASQQNVAISLKLLNKGRYPENNQAGIGNAVETYFYYKGTLYFYDPLRSEPVKIGYSGLERLKGKLSKFFKRTIQQDYKAGKKQIGWADVFSEYAIFSTEYTGDIVNQITFDSGNWITEDSYTYPFTYTIISDTNGVAIVTDNQATFTPDTNYVGSANFIFSFDGIQKKACITVIAGDTTPLPFYFLDITGAATSTLQVSNTILVSGINIPTAISITGGEYQINGTGSWLSVPSTVVNGDTVAVRQTSSSLALTTTNCTLTIGGVSDTFSVTTASGTPVDPPTSTLSYVYSAGVFTFSLTNPIYSTNVDIDIASVNGSDNSCTTFSETDSLSSLATIIAGTSSINGAGTTPLTIASLSYSIFNSIGVNGVTKVNGDTITIGGTVITIALDLSCKPYSP